MALSLCIASPAAADPVADAYEAFTGGEFEKARDIARGAVAADPSINSLVARKVLILSLRELGELDAATDELEKLRALDLVASDVAWADDRAAEIEALRAERGPTSPTEAVEAAEAAEEPTPESAPESTAESATESPQPGVETASGSASTPSSEGDKHAVFVALGGGFEQLGGWSYAAFGGEAGVRTVGPLWVVLGGELGLSPGADCSATPGDDDACTALLSAVRVGAMMRFDLAVQPYVHAGFVLGINGASSPYVAAVPGLEVGGGVELGAGPIAVRPRAAFRLLGALRSGESAVPGVTVGVDAVVRLGRRR